MTRLEVLPHQIGVDPVTRFVRSLPPGDWLLLKEVAHQLEISQFTLRKYINDDEPDCRPSKVAKFGKMEIYLFSPDDVNKIKRFFADRVEVSDYTGKRMAGRPRTYTPEQRLDRKRARARKWYWEERARVLLADGDTEGHTEALDRVKEIEQELADGTS